MVFEMPLGSVIISCLSILAYGLLFAQSLLHNDTFRENYKNFPHHLPILGIEDVSVYSAVCLIMAISSVSLIFGLILKRSYLIWPWILMSFQILGNYGYLMLSHFLELLDTGVTDILLQRFIAPGILFIIQIWLYIVVFRHFQQQRIAVKRENLANRL